MKKLILLLAFLCFCSPAFAARTSINKVIDAVTLDADPTSASGSIRVGSADKLSFFVSYDETEVGGIQVSVTLDVSYDGTNWSDASFYDYAGGSTLQTSETLTADTTTDYYFWMNSDLAVPYVRVVITATGSDADDTAIVSAKIITQEV